MPFIFYAKNSKYVEIFKAICHYVYKRGKKEDLCMEEALKIAKNNDIEEITLEEIVLEEIVPEGVSENTGDNSRENSEKSSEQPKEDKKDAPTVKAKEEPVDVEIMATWAGRPTVRTKGHPARDGWWLVYHPDDDDWYYLPEKNVKPAPKHRRLRDLFKKQAEK
jgi:hypothetical protein